jgi:hypothetical protein
MRYETKRRHYCEVMLRCMPDGNSAPAQTFSMQALKPSMANQVDNLFSWAKFASVRPTPKDSLADWFGDSQVKDELGMPRRVFTGVALDEDVDLLSFRGVRTPNIFYTGSVGHFHGSGSFFSESPDVASSFPAMNKKGLTRRVYPAYLRIANPKRYSTATYALKDYNENFDGDVHRYVRSLKELGFDGLTFKEGPSWAGKRKSLQAATWVAFDPVQVRFALASQ